ncbi:TetR/AcrR family transcriptional regulator [Microbacterium sp. GXF7504]
MSRPIGRPRVSSRATIAEAACELFLEQGYDATSISDITRRAGVARSSFFNYFGAKGDVLWGGFDERAVAVAEALAGGTPVVDALAGFAEGVEPDALALAITNVDAMGITAELERDRALRQRRVQRYVTARLARDGVGGLAAEVRAGAYAAAVMAALWTWADRTWAGPPLAAILADALDEAARVAD